MGGVLSSCGFDVPRKVVAQVAGLYFVRVSVRFEKAIAKPWIGYTFV